MNTFDPNIYMGPDSTPGYFGMESLNRARAAGYTDAEIDASIQAAGFQYGEQAAASINPSSGGSYSPSPSPSPSSSTSYFDPNIYMGPESTPGYFGMESLNKARAAGYTDAQIHASVTAAGFQYGEQAAASIQPYTTTTSTKPPTTPPKPTTPPVQGSTASGMPTKTTSATPPAPPTMNYEQAYAPPSPRDSTNLYESSSPDAGGDRNESTESTLDYTWQWDEMEDGAGASKDDSTETAKTMSYEDEKESYSDSWRRYTASGQPIAGSIFGV